MKVTQLCPTVYNPIDYIAHRIPQARILEWVAFPFPGNLPNPGMEPRSPAWHTDSLPDEPPEKTKNTGVGNLSLLQQIIQTQESNQGLLRCRQILSQLQLLGKSICDNTIFKCSHILRFWGIGLQHIFLPCHPLCAQSCRTLCDPTDRTLPGSSAHGIFQARILEWVVISSSRVSSRPRNRTSISCISCIVDRFFTH